MEKGFLAVFIIGLCMVGTGIVQSYVAKNKLNYFGFSTMTFVFGSSTAFLLLVRAHRQQSVFEIPGYSYIIITIVAAGLTGAIGFACVQWAMRRGIHGIAWAVSQMAMILPFLVAFLFFNEPIGWQKGVGMLAILMSIICFALGRKRKAPADEAHPTQKGWLVLTILAFLLMGVSMVFSSMPSYWPGHEYETGRYLKAFVYLFTCFWVYFIGKLISKHAIRRQEMKASLFHFSMAFVTSNLMFWSLDYMEKYQLAGAVYPGVTVVSILGMALYGKLFLKEIYNRYHVGGFLAGVLGMCFLAFSGGSQ